MAAAGPTADETFEVLKREAKALERQLDRDVQSYARLNSQADKKPGDIESGGRENEAALAAAIEAALAKIAEATDQMARCVATSSNRANASLVQRFRDIHRERTAEFRKTKAALAKRRDSADLFRTSSGGAAGNTPGSTRGAEQEALLRERSSLGVAHRAIDDILK